MTPGQMTTDCISAQNLEFHSAAIESADIEEIVEKAQGQDMGQICATQIGFDLRRLHDFHVATRDRYKSLQIPRG